MPPDKERFYERWAELESSRLAQPNLCLTLIVTAFPAEAGIQDKR